MAKFLHLLSFLSSHRDSQCFDYDWGLQDDFMGATKFSLNQIELNQPEEMILKLQDPARPLKDLGELKIVVTLTPKTQEDKEQVSGKKVNIFSCAMDIFFFFYRIQKSMKNSNDENFSCVDFLNFLSLFSVFSFRDLIFVI